MLNRRGSLDTFIIFMLLIHQSVLTIVQVLLQMDHTVEKKTNNII